MDQLSPQGATSTSARTTAIAGLAICCIFWGLSFPAMKVAADAFERNALAVLPNPPGPAARLHLAIAATFNAWRFTTAGLLYLLLTFRRQRNYRAADWRCALVGLFLGGGMLLQLVGLQYTLPSVSGFLTSLPVVFAPLAQWLIFKRRVGAWTWPAVAVAVAGIVIFSSGNPEAITTTPKPSMIPLLGEILTIAGSLVFTAQIMAVDRLGQNADPLKMTALAMLVTGLLNWAMSFAAGGEALHSPLLLRALASDHRFLIYSALLVCLCSVVSFHLMNIFQPRVSPAAASVVYCLEPVFATAFSVALGTEYLTSITVAGGAVILLAVLIVVIEASARPQETASHP